MEITYLSVRDKEKYENDNYLVSEFNKAIAKKFKEFLNHVQAANDIYQLTRMRPVLNVEKIKSKKDLFSARLNQQYRVEFSKTEDNQIKGIKIVRIQPHKY